jgi:hypothetical protein
MEDSGSKAILVLVLNLVMPGVGGLLYTSWFRADKRVRIRALVQLTLFWAGVILAACNKYLYSLLIMVFGVWIWAIFDGLELYGSLVEKP